MNKITTKDKIMQYCDETLTKITKEVQKKYNLTWDKATIYVDSCFRKLCIAK
jgi:hypothetical protein